MPEAILQLSSHCFARSQFERDPALIMAVWRGEEAARRVALTFWKFSERSRSGMFGSLLGLLPEEHGGTTRLESLGQNKSVVTTEIPAWCCHGGRLRLDAAVAMFDEISTYTGVVSWDRTWRPGVSIQLEGRALRPIEVGAGDRIRVETRLQKVGRTIGYLEIEIQDEDGDALIAGSHIKFMPMGPLFEMAFHPIWQNVSQRVWDAYLDKQPVHTFTMPNSIEEVFALQEVAHAAHVPKTFGKVEYAGMLPIDQRHGNPLGSIHGGASTMLGSLGAMEALRRRPEMAQSTVSSPVMVKANLLKGISTARKQTAFLCASLHADPAQAALPGAIHARASIGTPKGRCIECETVHLRV
mmetsp:Transcript_6153/g.12514  ORF Transcript_6153/g.12514 Transcript_6153/m.12514 type:complete len:355 (-) Transcript_6153:1014-2078(-)